MSADEPQVAYRETLSRAATIDYTHAKQTGGSGEYARVQIEFSPLPPGAGFEFENNVAGGSIPKEFIPAVENGIRTQKESGVMAGFPVIDFKARLLDGDAHEVDSSVLAFDIAARAAFRELANRGVVKLLEPIMKVEIATPEDFIGGVIGDLLMRRGIIKAMDTRGDDQVLTAMVPLSSMLGFFPTLQTITQERGSYVMQFDHYAAAPTPSGGDDPRFPGAAAMRVA